MLNINTSLQGSYIVSICCNEWRGGVIINTIKRICTYTIQNCNLSVSASIGCDPTIQLGNFGKTCLANCKDRTIAFKNNSTGATSYHWDFGVLGLKNDTSNLKDPVFSYPAKGRYKVSLKCFGTNCSDSISEFINIDEDILSADFTVDGNLCIGDSIQFNGLGASSSDMVAAYHWSFTNPKYQLQSDIINPYYAFQHDGILQVKMNVFNSKGCYALAEKDLNLTSLNVKAFGDTILPKGIAVKLYATGAETYHWDYGLEGDYIFYVTGSNFDGCIGKDSLSLIYSIDSKVFVPNAFSPNNDGLNDRLKISLSGYDLVYFKIYNRRGQEVFYTNNVNIEWDGRYKGGELGIDTYYWVASAIDLNDKIQIFKGDIILIR